MKEILDLEKKILSIRSEGGGIYVYTGIEAAFTALKDAPTPLKHVLLFSDCADSRHQFRACEEIDKRTEGLNAPEPFEFLGGAPLFWRHAPACPERGTRSRVPSRSVMRWRAVRS